MADCPGCSRRQVLIGLGAALVGCQAGTDPGPDAPAGIPCGTGLICIDLALPANAALNTAGGSLKVTVPGDIVIVIRVSATEVDALSDICTHARCQVGYNATSMLLTCPCHGSRFRLNGTVARGPAVKSLKVYTAVLDTSANTITITL